MRNPRAAAVLGLLVVCNMAACGSSPVHRQGSVSSAVPKSSTTSSTTTTSQTTPTPPLFEYPASKPAASFGTPVGSACSPTGLSLSWGGEVSEATQQHSLALNLKNVSGETCHLDGYPGISFVDTTARELPLTYRRGGDQMVTSSPPANVNLPADSTAYVLLNQMACEFSTKDMAVALHLIPPNATSSLELGYDQINGSIMAYCGTGDPGSVLDISPVEPTAGATFAH